MRIAMLGGTFNPVHIGHLALAEEAAYAFGYDLIVLVPSNIPPHKAVGYDPGPGERLGMLADAVRGSRRLAVSRCELDRGGVSYTVDTLAELSSAYRIDGRPGLILGDDLAPGFMSWRDAAGLLRRADVIVASRSGGPVEADFPHSRLDNAVLPISSSDIRMRIAAGRPWRWLVPGPAAARIERGRLYGFVPGAEGLDGAATAAPGGEDPDGPSRTR